MRAYWDAVMGVAADKMLKMRGTIMEPKVQGSDLPELSAPFLPGG